MARRPLNLDSLPSNNQTTPNIEPVARGRKRSQGGIAIKLRDIGNSLFATIIRPSLIDNALDFINEGATMLLKGPGANPRQQGGPEPYYKNYTRPRRAMKRTSRTGTGQRLVAQTVEIYEDIFYPTRQEAEAVLGKMMEMALEYGAAPVGALYALAGISHDVVHEDWGWDDLQGVRAQYTSDGYIIQFPEPIYLR